MKDKIDKYHTRALPPPTPIVMEELERKRHDELNSKHREMEMHRDRLYFLYSELNQQIDAYKASIIALHPRFASERHFMEKLSGHYPKVPIPKTVFVPNPAKKQYDPNENDFE